MQKNTYGKRRKRRPRGKKSRTYTIAQKAARAEIAKNERREVEMKSADASFVDNQIVTHNGFVIPLTSFVQKGTTAYQRVGNIIKAKGILIRMLLKPPGSFASHYMLRLIIVRWNAAGTPTAANILYNTGASRAPLSPLVRDASHKFQVLFDNLYQLGEGTDSPLKVEKIYLAKIGSCIWDDNDNLQKGHVFAIWVSDGSIDVPNITVDSRVRYTDQ